MKHPLQDRLASIVSTHEIDVIMLAECAVSRNIIEESLKRYSKEDYQYSASMFESDEYTEKIQIFSNFRKFKIVDQFSDSTGRLTIRRLRFEEVPEILLEVVHFYCTLFLLIICLGERRSIKISSDY